MQSPHFSVLAPQIPQGDLGVRAWPQKAVHLHWLPPLQRHQAVRHNMGQLHPDQQSRAKENSPEQLSCNCLIFLEGQITRKQGGKHPTAVISELWCHGLAGRNDRLCWWWLHHVGENVWESWNKWGSASLKDLLGFIRTVGQDAPRALGYLHNSYTHIPWGIAGFTCTACWCVTCRPGLPRAWQNKSVGAPWNRALSLQQQGVTLVGKVSETSLKCNSLCAHPLSNGNSNRNSVRCVTSPSPALVPTAMSSSSRPLRRYIWAFFA